MYQLATGCLRILKIRFLDIQHSDRLLKKHLYLQLLLRLLVVDDVSRGPKSMIRRAGPSVDARIIL
jgi:hypothetical protein